MDVPSVHSTCSPFQDQYETCIQMARCMLYEGGEMPHGILLARENLREIKHCMITQSG